MNRRELFRGIVGVGAGLVLPASLEANAETARRWWALGSVPGRDAGWHAEWVDWQNRYVMYREETFSYYYAMGRITDLQPLPTNQMGWALVSGRNDV